MASINKFIGIGNVGKDPEVRVTQSGDVVVNMSIAITEKYKAKDGTQKEVTEWVRLVFFGKLAEIVQQYITKGMQIYVEGKLKTEKYDKDGQTHYVTKVVGEKMQMLGSKSDKPRAETKQSMPQPSEFDIPLDDDIPF